MLGFRRRETAGEQPAAKPRRDAKSGAGFLGGLASPFHRLATFLREVRIEAGRVVWPSRDETYTYTVVVVVAVVVVAAWVGAWDFILTNLLAALKL
jgi:preprotein translocase subunit SecE